MPNPIATYRLQFHSGFTFDDLENIIPYLSSLGISTVYASPIFEAVTGSTHGYDAIDPHKINPEIGSIGQLKTLSYLLKAENISWLQDIVPNHMAFHQNNRWLMDVLEKGSLSLYQKSFDLPDTNELYRGRLMVPFLGSSLDDAINQSELKVAYENGRLVFKYYDNAWPLNIRSYEIILGSGGTVPIESIKQLLVQIHQIHEIEEPRTFSIAMDELKSQLSSLVKDPKIQSYLTACLQNLNKNKEQLLQLADHQTYRLCHWQETDTRINFRRFFTVNGLICLNVQNEAVFQYFHRLIKLLLERGIVHGLRIDHIDGLFDPADYLKRLRDLTGDNVYTVIEKILGEKENLPESWPVQGTTGYDFLGLVNNLFTAKAAENGFTSYYKTLTGHDLAIHKQIKEKKSYMLYQHMNGELDNLVRVFTELKLAEAEREVADIPAPELRKAIGEFLIHCPVYRYYGNAFPLNTEDADAVLNILKSIRNDNESLDAALDLLEDVFLHRPLKKDQNYNTRALRFYQLCMQFTGPLMAKGVEDTLMYTYNRFIGHNEVGDSPRTFGISTDEFHKKMQYRQKKWPLALNATSTHDTKRGEDVRARLNVLTDLEEEWLQTVAGWRKLNENLKENALPDENDEYFIYQTLIGSYPMPGQNEETFSTRIQQYLEKALREAKLHSNWSQPNEQYEEAAKRFAVALLDESKPFWISFRTFHEKVSEYGIINSLAQVLLKFTCPGVPDVYQGCELWDLSLVDPDNRRPVDYELRKLWLNELKQSDAAQLLTNLWESRYDGKIKLWLIQTLFKQRKREAELFEKGEYIPLKVKGRYKDHILAFARRYRQTWYITAIPLRLATLIEAKKRKWPTLNWKNTRIIIPPEAPEDWDHQFLRTKGRQKGEILVSEIFETIPLALLKLRQTPNDRGAGILMHITSLPSPFGVGDFGPEAKKFADFLSRSCQKYWQLLPLSPTELSSGHSPYSSYSSMGGNTLLISPDLLARDGLLNEEQLIRYHLPQKDKASYQEAENIKMQLFDRAWEIFKNGNHPVLSKEFDNFCSEEAYWLEDFALFELLKQQHPGKGWFEWPDQYKFRDYTAMKNLTESNSDDFTKIKWLQYLFLRQWKNLKAYCNLKGIQLFGDLPFYVGYDSVDVWSNPEIFSLDENGKMQSVAGVPPDYFNENGQLWGMPVFRWEKLKMQNFKWWVQRIRKNMELYDLLRLDHFRAFSAYWEVPADEETAVNGEWIPGPGPDFFQTLQKELGKLPFVAEDLGDIDDAVYKLRDEFGLPGMKVLQFAFGEDMPASTYIPHNFRQDDLVYTGTHDNNTTSGWYLHETGKTIRKRLKKYTGIQISDKNVHRVLARLAYASVAKIVILPAQDVPGLGEDARMNTPASTAGNWLWRLVPGKLTTTHEKQLRGWTKLYYRT